MFVWWLRSAEVFPWQLWECCGDFADVPRIVKIWSVLWWWKGVQPPRHIGFNDINRPLRWPQTGIWHLGLQENMHTDGVWCSTAQIQSKFRGSPAWESVQSPLWHPTALLRGSSWMSLMVLPKGVLCVEIWERSQRTGTYWSFLQTGLPPVMLVSWVS